MLTPSELADTQKLQTLDMQYYRVPLQYDTTPTEQVCPTLKEIVIIEKDFKFDHLDFKVFIQICMQWLSSDLSLQYTVILLCLVF